MKPARMTLRLVPILLLMGLGSACAPIYLPSAPNTPMLEKQGDGQATARVGTSGLEVQGAYAVTDRTYLIGGLAASDHKEEEGSDSSHRYLEVGAGTVLRPSANLVLEGAGGLGLGVGKGSVDYTLNGSRVRSAEGGYFKPFIQGNIALQGRSLDAGLVNRFSLLQFGEITRTDGDAVIDDSPKSLFWEPHLFVQVGSKTIRLQTHFGLTVPIAGNPEFDWHYVNAGIGLHYRFHSN